jgi:hypothetical protein
MGRNRTSYLFDNLRIAGDVAIWLHYDVGIAVLLVDQLPQPVADVLDALLCTPQQKADLVITVNGPEEPAAEEREIVLGCIF